MPRAPRNRTPDTDADMEPHPTDAALRADEAPAFDTPVRLHFHHYRKRLVDPDGLSVKAVIDGLIAAGILAGDTAEQVKEISHSQSKTGPQEVERTVVTISPLSLHTDN